MRRFLLSRALRAHFRSNIVGYIALFALILGGTAQALPGRGVVDHDDLQRHVVHLGNIHDGTINSAKVARDSLTGGDIDESSLVGVAEAGLKLGERCQVVSWFNDDGGEPTGERIGPGHCRLTVPGLERSVSAGSTIFKGFVLGVEPAYLTHVFNSDGTLDVFVWDKDGAPASTTAVGGVFYDETFTIAI